MKAEIFRRIFFCLNKPLCDDPIIRKERNELVFYFSLGKRTYALHSRRLWGLNHGRHGDYPLLLALTGTFRFSLSGQSGYLNELKNPNDNI